MTICREELYSGDEAPQTPWIWHPPGLISKYAEEGVVTAQFDDSDESVITAKFDDKHDDRIEKPPGIISVGGTDESVGQSQRQDTRRWWLKERIVRVAVFVTIELRRIMTWMVTMAMAYMYKVHIAG
jgi:hypothetical protein